jgi:hypothetical protein
VALVQGNGITNYTASIDAVPEKNASYSLKLFMDATNHTGRIKGINPASVRLYGLKIHDGADLKRDYSPRLVDNVPGIYDAVTGVFTNSVSSKGLHFGGDLACVSGAAGLGGNADAYIEFTGSQSINTGYIPTRNTRIVMDYGVFDRSAGTTSARCFFARCGCLAPIKLPYTYILPFPMRGFAHSSPCPMRLYAYCITWKRRKMSQ